MKFGKFLTIGAMALSLVAGSAFAQDKAAKQAEVVKASMAALDKFYAKNADLKTQVAKAPGYAVFTTYGVSFLIGGSSSMMRTLSGAPVMRPGPACRRDLELAAGW